MTQASLTSHAVTYGYDADGNRVTTAVSPQTGGTGIGCSGNTATFVRQDGITQGNWIGTYGADGYSINAEPPVQPSYGAVSFAGNSNYTWTTSATDTRALQEPAPQTSRIASTYYSFTSETVHVATTDNEEHVVALYMLDYDSSGRAQTVTAQTTSGAVLDGARPYAGMTNGLYGVYRICGSVDFVLDRTAGPNAVVSGVFLGTPDAATAVTNYVVDTSGGLSQVSAETDGGNNVTALYVRNGDELLAVMRPGGSAGMWTTHFVHSDGLGSVRTITDETGAVVDTRGYEAFGTKNVEAGSETLAYGFAGEPLDATTHLAYHRARWMDSRVGRFTGMDSFPGINEFPETLHKYAYVVNEPTDLTDANGRISPQSLVIGNAVHKEISAAWIAGEKNTTLNGRVANLSISTLLDLGPFPPASNWLYKLKFGVSTLARPDLAATVEHDIYEIKSNDEFGQGEIKLAQYLNLLNALDPNEDWFPGGDDEYTPPESFVMTNVGGFNYNVTVSPPVDGVITYTWTNADPVGVAVLVGVGIGLGVFGDGPAEGVSGVGGL